MDQLHLDFTLELERYALRSTSERAAAEREHFAALPTGDMQAFMRLLSAAPGLSTRASEFNVLTVMRANGRIDENASRNPPSATGASGESRSGKR
ncbi:hypothetical protein [Pseudorhodoferax soli]|uniref:hypothetical protein n=1 Tax=Pseudorhodoferax soli TaxID=545864 RepID=UPI0011C03100|nr:hypothetical protein [Pseudorhodoferax soli]